MPTCFRPFWSQNTVIAKEKFKFLGSGGSMVARLKLKEIDGRAPPGLI